MVCIALVRGLDAAALSKLRQLKGLFPSDLALRVDPGKVLGLPILSAVTGPGQQDLLAADGVDL